MNGFGIIDILLMQVSGCLSLVMLPFCVLCLSRLRVALLAIEQGRVASRVGAVIVQLICVDGNIDRPLLGVSLVDDRGMLLLRLQSLAKKTVVVSHWLAVSKFFDAYQLIRKKSKPIDI